VLRYLVRRLLLACGTVWLVSLVVFVLLRSSPDDCLLQQGLTCTPERAAAVREELGLNDPLAIQYVSWLGRVLTGDLGRSALTQVSVTQEFRARFPVTLQLMLMTVTWVGLFGLVAGLLSARWRNAGLDHCVRLAGIFGLSLPAFWVATLILMVPAQLWHYAPLLGQPVSPMSDPFGNLQLFLPASLVLALAPAALVMRLTRSSLIEVLGQDFIRTARSKGLPEREILVRHALSNALIPIVTVLGLVSAELLAGSVMIESVFALRGLGSYVFEALLQRDYPVAQSMVFYAASLVVFMNLAVDILYGVLDPRIRYS